MAMERFLTVFAVVGLLPASLAAPCDDRPSLELFSGYTSDGTVHLRDEVEYVQEKVGVEGDGFFGPDTVDAVIAYQTAKCLAVDGEVGPETWSAICDGVDTCGGSTPTTPTPTTPTPTTPSSCVLSNGVPAQAKSACTPRSDHQPDGPWCWTDRAWKLYEIIQACLPNIECTTYPSDASSDHAGNGLDCWSKSGRPCPATGTAKDDLDALRDWGRTNAVAVEIGYINWYQQQWSQRRASEGMRSYGDRGGCTNNHYDHVHFSVCAGSYNAASYGC